MGGIDLAASGQSPAENPDVQEALSLRYVVGLRLALLDSGAIAVFDRGGLVSIFKPRYAEDFEDELWPLLRKDKEFIDSYTPAESESKPLATSKSAEDLGL